MFEFSNYFMGYWAGLVNLIRQKLGNLCQMTGGSNHLARREIMLGGKNLEFE
jgi:hypothetical protein